MTPKSRGVSRIAKVRTAAALASTSCPLDPLLPESICASGSGLGDSPSIGTSGLVEHERLDVPWGSSREGSASGWEVSHGRYGDGGAV